MDLVRVENDSTFIRGEETVGLGFTLNIGLTRPRHLKKDLTRYLIEQ